MATRLRQTELFYIPLALIEAVEKMGLFGNVAADDDQCQSFFLGFFDLLLSMKCFNHDLFF